MQDLPENHFWVSGASWVNISNYYLLLSGLSKQFTIKSGIKKEDGVIAHHEFSSYIHTVGNVLAFLLCNWSWQIGVRNNSQPNEPSTNLKMLIFNGF